MSRAGGVPLATWLAAFRVLRAWHRYEVRGLETLLEPGAKLIVAYHGRPLALDQCMLGARGRRQSRPKQESRWSDAFCVSPR